MAALYAYEIDNCLIEVNAPEFPILDGSSRFFSEEIQKAGVVEQNAPKRLLYRKKHKIEVKDEKLVLPSLSCRTTSLASMFLISLQFVCAFQPVRHAERPE